MLSIIFFSFLLIFLSIIFFKPKETDIIFVVILSIYHFSFSYLFLIFSADKVNDSRNYYDWSFIRSYDSLSYTSTDLIIYLVKLITSLGFNYDEVLLIFSFMSGLAIIGFFSYFSKNYDFLKIGFINSRNIFLIPGLHFWTVAIGKDSLCLLAIYFICTSSFRGRKIKLLMGLVLLFLVRYHILIIFIIAIVIHIFFTSKYKIGKYSRGVLKSIVILLIIPSSLFLYQYIILSIQKYSSSGFNDIGDFLENRSEAYADAGSGVLISSQPYIVKVFALIFGGVPWISLEPLSLAAMLEGLIILVLLYYGVKELIKYNKTLYSDTELPKIFLWFIIVFLLIMPLISGNLGIMVRMRVMLYFPIFLVLIYSHHFLNKYTVKL